MCVRAKVGTKKQIKSRLNPGETKPDSPSLLRNKLRAQTK